MLIQKINSEQDDRSNQCVICMTGIDYASKKNYVILSCHYK